MVEDLCMSLGIAVVVPIAFAIFGAAKVRGEKKISSQGVIRTRPPLALSGFFLGFAILVFFGGIAAIIYCCIADREHATVAALVIVSVCVAAFSGLGFFGYAYIRFNFVVADEEGILAYRLFRKKRYYRYEEIGAFQDTIGLGALGGLIGYDKNNAKIFAVEALHIGVSLVAERLREHGVQEKSPYRRTGLY